MDQGTDVKTPWWDERSEGLKNDVLYLFGDKPDPTRIYVNYQDDYVPVVLTVYRYLVEYFIGSVCKDGKIGSTKRDPV